MKKYSKILTKDFLYKEYIINNKSAVKIAKEVGCSDVTIGYYLKKYNIKIKIIKQNYSKILTKEFLIKEYITNRKSTVQIAKTIGCGHSTVLDYLKKYNIPIRTYSEATKGNLNGNYKGNQGLCKQKYHCIDCNKVICYQTWKEGTKRCPHHALVHMWQNKEFRDKRLKAMFKGLNLSPNKPEQLLIKLLNKLLPKQYKFVGDGKLIIAGFCPDFVNCNGQKKIIEHFGGYWHNKPELKQRDKRRVIAYEKYGYKALIIWERELKDLNKLENKIINFNKA